MKQHLVFASLIVSLLVLSGCSDGIAAAPAAGNPSPAAIAINSSGGANCKAYVAAVRTVCLDSVTRGLDVSCDSQLVAVDMVQTQAAGTLFDVGSGSANAKVAESACASFLKSLQRKRQRKDAGMHAESGAGPKCNALAEKLDSTCLRDLGKQPIPDKCRSATRMLNALSSQPAENRCAMAEQQLK